MAGSTGEDAMTRSEERLRVGAEGIEAGRARLRKYVVTENVTTQVPVSHEEVRVEREPVTEASRDTAMAGVDITEAEHHVTLHAERPVVERKPSRWSGSGWAPRRSPKSRKSARPYARSRSKNPTSAPARTAQHAERACTAGQYATPGRIRLHPDHLLSLKGNAHEHQQRPDRAAAGEPGQT
jgi:uncharacterized protein (TIGR02271 family)